MRANIEFISRKYREFNDLCFGGTLPEVPLRISRSRRTLGCLKYRRSRRLFGKDRLTDFSIWISNCLDLSQDVIEDTLIHEMIHLYIHSNGPWRTVPQMDAAYQHTARATHHNKPAQFRRGECHRHGSQRPLYMRDALTHGRDHDNGCRPHAGVRSSPATRVVERG